MTYSDQVWLKEYPASVPHTVDVSAYSSVADVVEKSCEQFRKLPPEEQARIRQRFHELREQRRAPDAEDRKLLGCEPNEPCKPPKPPKGERPPR